jgi:hypothetical protein
MTTRFLAPAWFWLGLWAAFASPCFAQAPITNGLIARWSGDGSAMDSAGHFDGKVSGGLTYVPGPAAAQSFQFNGGDARVDFGTNAGNFGPRDFTVAYWMKTDSKIPQQAFLSKRLACDASSTFWDIRIGSAGLPQILPVGVLAFEIREGGDDVRFQYDLYSSRPMNDGLWHHVAWVRQSTSSGSDAFLIYVDGMLDNSKAIPKAVDLSNQGPLLLGQNVCQGRDSTHPFSGAAAELQLFSHALSPDEILSIYKAGKPNN